MLKFKKCREIITEIQKEFKSKKKISNFSKNIQKKKSVKKMGPSPGCADSRTV
jgi:hypothetical protein